MSFQASMYENFVAADSQARERLIPHYIGMRTDFDIVIVGSGVGGGVLADDLAERLGDHLRILVLEAGSFLYPTHAYNICRFQNFNVAKKFACGTFWQQGDSAKDKLYIGEQPQLNFGGRSIFWSGLIPTPQDWELHFFPPRVRQDLVLDPLHPADKDLLHRAGEMMNQSVSLGRVAEQVVARLQNSWLAADFSIKQTPRALHQPYLEADGAPKDKFFTESTGVFNTAELLINQLGLAPSAGKGNGPGLYLLLNHFVEDVQDQSNHLELVVRNTLTGQAKTFQAGKVVLAGGSIESPKLLRRSSIYGSLSPGVKNLVGRGLTDHPTTDSIHAFVDGIGGINLDDHDHAKIIFYSLGLQDQKNEIRYPFNVEMNINHEYWHLRRNDPADPVDPEDPTPRPGKALIDIKFSFGNCLDDDNEVKAPVPHLGYVPEIAFHNTKLVERLAESRFPALASWRKKPDEIWDVLNDITVQIFSLFRLDGQPAKPEGESKYGRGKGFGYGTVHHAAGSLRMPSRPRYDQDFAPVSVVDQDLQVIGTERLYVCDMSVMPISTAANPVRALVALSLRLSEHLAKQNA
ncbi:MAG TPA: GMC oxidoreductase [Terrimicrobiaceae bacterium]